MDEKKRYIIQVANNLEDDSIVVEIIYDNALLAELFRKDSGIQLVFHDAPPTSLDAETFLKALHDAIDDAKTLPS